MTAEDQERPSATLPQCCCNTDPFAALPPEERPRNKSPLDNLRHVICPVCGLEYWTNRAGDICSECAKKSK
jgi:hypothetical protein